MNYPTIRQIETAERLQLARWYRFLPSPGSCAIGASLPKFKEKLEEEKVKMDKIVKRFKSMGGMSPSISKQIGLV